jgi:hypothetical protein
MASRRSAGARPGASSEPTAAAPVSSVVVKSRHKPWGGSDEWFWPWPMAVSGCGYEHERHKRRTQVRGPRMEVKPLLLL